MVIESIQLKLSLILNDAIGASINNGYTTESFKLGQARPLTSNLTLYVLKLLNLCVGLG